MTVGVFVLVTGAVRLLREAGFEQAPFMVLIAGLMAGMVMMVLSS
ncbi:hypothetical protein [Methylobacterium radiotolerans]|nr:hypothetical protein [Methylobacterium radiotolerans]